MNITRSIALSTAFLAALSLAACSNGTDTAASDTVDPGKISVMASFYPLEYLTKEVGGDLVSVESLTPAGAEPHDLELSPAKADEVGKADAVVYIKGFQEAVDEAVEHNAPKTVVDLAEKVDLVETSADGNHKGKSHEHEGDHHHEHEGDHEHQHEGDHHHEHEGDHHHEHDSDHHHDGEAAEEGHHHHHDMTTDPHFWLDPERMAKAATAIGEALAQADEKNAATYKANAEKVAAEMMDLSQELIDSTATCEHTTFVTAHAAFGYLADRTGLTQIGISGIDPDSTPSPERLKEISDLVKKEGVTTLFTEALIDPKVAKTLADDLGISTAVLDPIESQTDESKDYAHVMRDNIATLQTALTCK